MEPNADGDDWPKGVVDDAPKAGGLGVAPNAEGAALVAVVAPKADVVAGAPNADGADDPKAEGVDAAPNADVGVLVEPNAEPDGLAPKAD